MGQELMLVGERRNDPRALGFSLWMLGWLSLQEGYYEEALTFAESSIASSLYPADAGDWSR